MSKNGTIRRLAWADAHLADIPLPSGVMHLTRSLTSGLCQSPIDGPDVFWGSATADRTSSRCRR